MFAISVISTALGHNYIVLWLALYPGVKYYYNPLIQSGWNSVKPDSSPIFTPLVEHYCLHIGNGTTIEVHSVSQRKYHRKQMSE